MPKESLRLSDQVEYLSETMMIFYNTNTSEKYNNSLSLKKQQQSHSTITAEQTS